MTGWKQTLTNPFSRDFLSDYYCSILKDFNLLLASVCSCFLNSCSCTSYFLTVKNMRTFYVVSVTWVDYSSNDRLGSGVRYVSMLEWIGNLGYDIYTA